MNSPAACEIYHLLQTGMAMITAALARWSITLKTSRFVVVSGRHDDLALA